MSASCGREGIFIGAYEATVSVMMPVVTMMSLAAALATKLSAAVQTTRNVVFAVSAFVGFLQHIMIAEFAASRATHLVMMLLGFVFVLAVLHGLVVDFATVSLVVLTVMLFVLLVDFVPVM
jgi:hypothetical protein